MQVEQLRPGRLQEDYRQDTSKLGERCAQCGPTELSTKKEMFCDLQFVLD